MKVIDQKERFNKKIVKREYSSKLRQYASREANAIRSYDSEKTDSYEQSAEDAVVDPVVEEAKQSIKDTIEDKLFYFGNNRRTSSSSLSRESAPRRNTIRTSRDFYQNLFKKQTTSASSAVKSAKTAETAKKTVEIASTTTKAAASSGGLAAAAPYILLFFGILLIPFLVVIALIVILPLIISILNNPISQDSFALSEALRIFEVSYRNVLCDSADEISDDDSFPIIYNDDIDWKNVIALYYAYTCDKPINDATNKFQVGSDGYTYLNDVFWASNKCTTRFNATYPIEEISLYWGGALTSYEQGTMLICYHPSPEQVADELNFNTTERIALSRYLNDDDFDEHVQTIIQMIESGSGTGTGMVNTARSELNNNYQKYCSWYGFYTDWCAIFVSWCGYQNGYTGIIPRLAGVKQYYNWFNNPNTPGYFIQTHDAIAPGTLNIQPGWLHIKRTSEYTYKHIGIVVDYDPETQMITTISGNTGSSQSSPYYMGSSVRQARFRWTNDNTTGFCVPQYPDSMLFDENEILMNYVQRVLGVSNTDLESMDDESRETVYNMIYDNSRIPSDFRRCADYIIGLLNNGEAIPDSHWAYYNSHANNWTSNEEWWRSEGKAITN